MTYFACLSVVKTLFDASETIRIFLDGVWFELSCRKEFSELFVLLGCKLVIFRFARNLLGTKREFVIENGIPTSQRYS
jgi:hypothetical protein